jgi:hypothetical protein
LCKAQKIQSHQQRPASKQGTKTCLLRGIKCDTKEGSKHTLKKERKKKLFLQAEWYKAVVVSLP